MTPYQRADASARKADCRTRASGSSAIDHRRRITSEQKYASMASGRALADVRSRKESLWPKAEAVCRPIVAIRRRFANVSDPVYYRH